MKMSLMLGAALYLSVVGVSAQYDNRDRASDPISRVEPGATISVRTNATIDADARDSRIYTGIVDQDVRGDDGRVAIPRGSTVELIVRGARNNDLVLDIESVTAHGQRYAVRTEGTRVDAGDFGVVGSIV